MGLSLKELDQLIAVLQESPVWHNSSHFALALPEPQLIHALGPLTAKMAKRSTIGTAVALNYALGNVAAAPATQAKINALRHAAMTLSVAFNDSHSRLGAPAVAGVIALINANDAHTISKTSAALRTKLPDQRQDPIYAKLIDTTLTLALAAIPVVGPILAGACKDGIASLIEDASDAITGELSGDAKVASKVAGKLVGVVDVGKETPGSVLVGLIQRYRTRKQQGDVDKLLASAEAKQAWETQFNRILNPLSQNQVAHNVAIDKLRFKANGKTADFTKAETNLKTCLNTPSATVESYLDKISQSLKYSADLLNEVVKSSIIHSFEEELNEYKTLLANPPGASASFLPPIPLHPPVAAIDRDESNAKHLALIILAYYINIVIRANKAGGGGGFLAVLDTPATRGLLDPSLYNPTVAPTPIASALKTTANSVSAVRGPANGNQDADAKSFLFGRKGLKSVPVDDFRLVLSTVEKQADNYIGYIKNSMIRTVQTSLHRHDNNIEQILTTFAACNIIVNSALKAGIKGDMGATFKIPVEAVSVLADPKWGFVTTYSTLTGHVSAKEKFDKMGVTYSEQRTDFGTILKLDWNPKGARIRWFKAKIAGGASSSEQAMMYLFARGALTQMNVINLITGVESWEKQKDGLHAYIAKINQAFHDKEALEIQNYDRKKLVAG